MGWMKRTRHSNLNGTINTSQLSLIHRSHVASPSYWFLVKLLRATQSDLDSVTLTEVYVNCGCLALAGNISVTCIRVPGSWNHPASEHSFCWCKPREAGFTAQVLAFLALRQRPWPTSQLPASTPAWDHFMYWGSESTHGCSLAFSMYLSFSPCLSKIN